VPSKNVVRIVAGVVGIYAIGLLIGFFVLQQILLSLLITTLLLLIGIFAYTAWESFDTSDKND
jgi:hypothetical protein